MSVVQVLFKFKAHVLCSSVVQVYNMYYLQTPKLRLFITVKKNYISKVSGRAGCDSTALPKTFNLRKGMGEAVKRYIETPPTDTVHACNRTKMQPYKDARAEQKGGAKSQLSLRRRRRRRGLRIARLMLLFF